MSIFYILIGISIAIIFRVMSGECPIGILFSIAIGWPLALAVGLIYLIGVVGSKMV